MKPNTITLSFTDDRELYSETHKELLRAILADGQEKDKKIEALKAEVRRLKKLVK